MHFPCFFGVVARALLCSCEGVFGGCKGNTLQYLECYGWLLRHCFFGGKSWLGEVVAYYTFTLQLLECFGGLLGNSYAVARVF